MKFRYFYSENSIRNIHQLIEKAAPNPSKDSEYVVNVDILNIQNKGVRAQEKYIEICVIHSLLFELDTVPVILDVTKNPIEQVEKNLTSFQLTESAEHFMSNRKEFIKWFRIMERRRLRKNVLASTKWIIAVGGGLVGGFAALFSFLFPACPERQIITTVPYNYFEVPVASPDAFNQKSCETEVHPIKEDSTDATGTKNSPSNESQTKTPEKQLENIQKNKESDPNERN